MFIVNLLNLLTVKLNWETNRQFNDRKLLSKACFLCIHTNKNIQIRGGWDMQEKRQTPRIETDLSFISCSSGISTDSRITDMSTTGAFIETSEPLPIDAELDLHLQLPGDSDIMSIDARVVWTKLVCCAASAGMGIQFTNILPKHLEKLAAFIEQNREPNGNQEQATVYV